MVRSNEIVPQNPTSFFIALGSPRRSSLSTVTLTRYSELVATQAWTQMHNKRRQEETKNRQYHYYRF
ncbi:Isonitrile hydratase [Fusarium oxysporum f. sp. albedinis]|nr:Isonitrile hydratase [Fusarium oxysporum f. sp. albedinis]